MRTLLLLILLSPALLSAQNLVIDGGLEDTIKCPQSIGRFYHPTNTNEQYTAQWRATTLASPDYNNTCGYNTFQPRTGNGYAGMLYYDPSEYREYISALLSQPLVAGEKYYIEYYVARNANSTLATDNLHIHFSNGVPLDMTFPPPGPLNLAVHMQLPSPPTLDSWQKIAGCYVASGSENVMTFGNFYDNANTSTLTVSPSGSVNAYYFIDDVSLIHIDNGVSQAGSTLTANMSGAEYQWIDCENGNAAIPGEVNQSFTATNSGSYALVVGFGTCTDTSACFAIDLSGLEENKKFGLSVYPNPTNDVVTVKYSGTINNLSLMDASGREIMWYDSVESDTMVINMADLLKGIYFIRVKSDSGEDVLEVVKE